MEHPDFIHKVDMFFFKIKVSAIKAQQHLYPSKVTTNIELVTALLESINL